MSITALDLGSATLRARVGDSAVREFVPPERGHAPVHRGAVADAIALRRALRDLVPRTANETVRVSMPMGIPAEAREELLDVVASALDTRRAVAVTAAVAAVKGAGMAPPVFVVDLGAELTEIAWVGPKWRHIGTSLPWGVRDLPLGHVSPENLLDVIGPRIDEVARVLQRLRSAALLGAAATSTPHLLVGGGALVPALRDLLERMVGGTWRVPQDPMQAVIRGLHA